MNRYNKFLFIFLILIVAFFIGIKVVADTTGYQIIIQWNFC